jgi:antitoxin (DNA-binding transcriptional repressor) of toxin-antitoxin stability system
MKTVIWTENTPWDEVLREGEQEEVILMRDGHAIALLVPFDDDDLDWYARERNPSFLVSIAQARRQIAQGRTMSHEDLKRELGL